MCPPLDDGGFVTDREESGASDGTNARELIMVRLQTKETTQIDTVRSLARLSTSDECMRFRSE